MAKQRGQKGFQDDRSDRESGQPLQLDNEKMNDDPQDGQPAQGEKQHQGGQGGQPQPQSGQQQGGNR